MDYARKWLSDLTAGLTLIGLLTAATSRDVTAQDTTAQDTAAADTVARLQQQLAQAQARNAELQERLKKTEAVMAAEKAQARAALTKLEAERLQLRDEQARLRQQAAQQAARRAKSAGEGSADPPTDASAVRDTITALHKEVDLLRKQLQEMHAQRDKNLKSVVELTDQLHSAFNEIKRLKELNARLAAGQPDPPAKTLHGAVTAVEKDGLLAISLGTDDGLLPGHRLTVYRGSGAAAVSLGTVQVVQATGDKAICRIEPAAGKGPAEKGDRVTTGQPAKAASTNVPAASDEPPHLVGGTVLGAAENGELEISFGSRDGLKPGHHLDVYRLVDGQGIYISRVQVIKTGADKSICRDIPEFRRDTIRPGDRIVSKID